MNHLTVWIALAALCFLLEFVIPGAILSFLGIGAALVALGLYLGWIEGWVDSLTTFFVVSIFLVSVIRSLFLKLLPGDSSVANVDEDQQAIGAMVEVVQDISPSKLGRVRFRQSTWEAESDEYIQKGEKVLIVSRSGQRWIVQSLLKGNQTP